MAAWTADLCTLCTFSSCSQLAVKRACNRLACINLYVWACMLQAAKEGDASKVDKRRKKQKQEAAAEAVFTVDDDEDDGEYQEGEASGGLGGGTKVSVAGTSLLRYSWCMGEDGHGQED